MTPLEQIKKELLPLVRQMAWLKLDQPIKLASGKLSDRYFDGRRVTLHPKTAPLIARAILEMVSLNDIDAVGGPSMGADPIVTAVSIFAWLDKQKELPAFLIRKDIKRHGLQKRIEGAELKSGMRVLVVEDTVTSGRSVKEAADAVEATGANVAAVVCLLDRGEGGAEALKPYPLIPIFTRGEINNDKSSSCSQ